ncbi:MAG TPA: hypothetical protein VF717_08440 [Pyrinomonadaceae bacterium]|jgi:hypothetical protein
MDDTLNYCLSDGTPLVKEPSPQGAQPTLVLPAFESVPNRQIQETSPYQRIEHQPQGLIQTSQTVSRAPLKRSGTRWLIAGVILLLGGVGIGLFVAYVISGSGNNQSAPANNSSRPGNSSVSQNSNNNQKQSNTSPGPPYAAFAGRTGLYKGIGINTTSDTRGTINLNITEINADTGYVSSMLTSGGKLCGDAPLSGKLTAEGKMNLTGTLTCKAADYTAPMTVRCQFTTSDTLNCTYTLKNSDYTPATQQGNFKLTKE